MDEVGADEVSADAAVVAAAVVLFGVWQGGHLSLGSGHLCAHVEDVGKLHVNVNLAPRVLPIKAVDV